MPSTSDFPLAGKGASRKTRSNFSSTSPGHLSTNFFRIAALVLNPCRHRILGFFRISFSIWKDLALLFYSTNHFQFRNL
ncbi:conserved hypothetical protein, partial [Ricinus communis]